MRFVLACSDAGPGEIGWPCEWVDRYVATAEASCRGNAYCAEDRNMCKEACVDTREIKGADIKRLNNDGEPDGSGAWCDYSSVGILYHVHTVRSVTGLSLGSLVIGLMLMMVGLTLIFQVYFPSTLDKVYGILGKMRVTKVYDSSPEKDGLMSYQENHV